VGKIEDAERGGLFIFHHNTKSPSFGGTQKLYWRMVLEGLNEFFKFHLCCYYILKIKNILISPIFSIFVPEALPSPRNSQNKV